MNDKKIIGLVVIIVLVTLLFFVFSLSTKSSITSTPKRDISLNGENLLIEVNNYRKENGLSGLSRDSDLCYRIGAFWEELQDFRNSRKIVQADEGQKTVKMLNDFVNLNKGNGAYKDILKQDGVFGGGEDVVETVKTWKALANTANVLLNKDFNIGCAYGKDGTSIVLVGEKTQ